MPRDGQHTLVGHATRVLGHVELQQRRTVAADRCDGGVRRRFAVANIETLQLRALLRDRFETGTRQTSDDVSQAQIQKTMDTLEEMFTRKDHLKMNTEHKEVLY